MSIAKQEIIVFRRYSCSLLEEGPPYPPVPGVGHWKPDKYVGILFF